MTGPVAPIYLNAEEVNVLALAVERMRAECDGVLRLAMSAEVRNAMTERLAVARSLSTALAEMLIQLERTGGPS